MCWVEEELEKRGWVIALGGSHLDLADEGPVLERVLVYWPKGAARRLVEKSSAGSKVGKAYTGPVSLYFAMGSGTGDGRGEVAALLA